jgi:hypothetical protein
MNQLYQTLLNTSNLLEVKNAFNNYNNTTNHWRNEFYETSIHKPHKYQIKNRITKKIYNIKTNDLLLSLYTLCYFTPRNKTLLKDLTKWGLNNFDFTVKNPPLKKMIF